MTSNNMVPVGLGQHLPYLTLYYPAPWTNDPLPDFIPKLDASIKCIGEDTTFLNAMSQSLQRGTGPLTTFQFNASSLMANTTFHQGWQLFKEELFENSQDVLNLMSLAAHAVMVEAFQVTVQHPILIGVYDAEQVMKLPELDVSLLDKYVTIVGRVVHAETVRPTPSIFYFECLKCCLQFPVCQRYGKYTKPRQCHRHPICESIDFQFLHNARGNVFHDSRWIVLQELFGGKGDQKDKVPVSCQVMIRGSHEYREFDIVWLGAMVVSRVADFKKSSSFHETFLYGSAIIPRTERVTHNELDVSDQDITLFRQMANSRNNFLRLCNSIKPEIAGMSELKAGLLLALVGGRESETGRRSNIHILIVGDPGTGKSQLLDGVLALSKRGELVIGTSITPAGMTLTVTKSSTGFNIRTGAIPRSSDGILAIDEFDKLEKDTVQYLLEAMSQQVVSVAKASVSRRLTAKVSILAAGNPKFNMYRNEMTFTQNVKISEALLNRFDLSYVVLDRPDSEKDTMHVRSFFNRFPALAPLSRHLVATQEDVQDEEMVELTTTDEPIINQALLSKYIAYARENCSPILDDSARAYILESYLSFKHQCPRSRVVSTRQLEALLRLTEARAKIDLVNIATISHAREACRIFMIAFRSSLSGTEANVRLSHHTATPSAPTTQRTHTRSLRDHEVGKLIDILQARATQKNTRIFSRTTIGALVRVHMLRTSADTLIELLNNRAILLATGENQFRLA